MDHLDPSMDSASEADEMESDSVSMETNDDDDEDDSSSMDENQPEQTESTAERSGGAQFYQKPVHLKIKYHNDEEDSCSSSQTTETEKPQKKRTSGDDPTALAILRRQPLDLQHGYRILLDLMSDRCFSFAWPFIEEVDPVKLNLPDYHERVKKPMWLGKIEEKFEECAYPSITEFVADVRLILENCYRYNGLSHPVSRQAETLEAHFERKLGLLSRHIREKTYMFSSSNSSSSGRRRFSQRILESNAASTPVANMVRRDLEDEEETQRKQRIIERREELERLNKRTEEWEKEELLKEPYRTQLRAMWEIPAIGQFLKLCGPALLLPDFSLCELERAFFLPQSSQLLAYIFTHILTTRFYRPRIAGKQPMPYPLWQERLRKKLDVWFASLKEEGATTQSVARQLYISVRFFEVLGETNPLVGREFHDLSVYERVWVTKGLCDHFFETDLDAYSGIVEETFPEDQRPKVLGQDAEKWTFLCFPHFMETDLRIYRHARFKEDKQKHKKVKGEKKTKEDEQDAQPSPTKRGRKPKTATPQTGPTSQGTPGPRPRGRPRKDGSTPSQAATPQPCPTSGDIPSPRPRGRPRKDGSTPSQAATRQLGPTAQGTPGPRPRGRPRKDGSTPSQAAWRKAAAKPTAVVTPVRRSSRMAARAEKAQKEAEETKMDCTPPDDAESMEVGKDEGDGCSGQTESEDTSANKGVCQTVVGRTENEREAESRQTVPDASCDSSNALAGTDSEMVPDDSIQGRGESPEATGGESLEGPVGKSLSEYSPLCNGVMEDPKQTDTHSRMKTDLQKDQDVSEGRRDEKPQEKDNDSQEKNGPEEGESILDKTEGNVNGSLECPNKNQSNNVENPGFEVKQVHVPDGKAGEEVNGSSAESLTVQRPLSSDGEEMRDGLSKEEGSPCRKPDGTADTALQILPKEANPEGLDVEDNDNLSNESDATTRYGDPQLGDAVSTGKESGSEKPIPKELLPPPPPAPTPGLSPPLDEFELVCDSVESLRALVEKFNQTEETITKGKKTIVQPIKRSSRVVELGKALAAVLEDVEPEEKRLVRVVHKAREKLYQELEAFRKDPSISVDAIRFWYHTQKFMKVDSTLGDGIDYEEEEEDDVESSSSEESESELDSEEEAPSVGVAEGGKEALEPPEMERGEEKKVDLYTGVEIAGRTMRSSKRRRAQARDVVREQKKAKRSKIQIVKGASRSRGFVARNKVPKEEEEEEEPEVTREQLHEELKASIVANAVRRQTPEEQMSNKFHPQPTNRKPGVKLNNSTPPQREHSGRFIRLLKHTTGTGKPGSSCQSPRQQRNSPLEPTLKVPFLQKNQKQVEETDKKMKTETFSFTIDAKLWESLKDRPEERQRLIMEHVQKMRNSNDLKKESPQKTQNSRNSPWFSRNTSPTSQVGSRTVEKSSQEVPSSQISASSPVPSSSNTQAPETIAAPLLLHHSMTSAMTQPSGPPTLTAAISTAVQPQVTTFAPSDHGGNQLLNQDMPVLAPALSSNIPQVLATNMAGVVPNQLHSSAAQGQKSLALLTTNPRAAVTSSGNNVHTTSSVAVTLQPPVTNDVASTTGGILPGSVTVVPSKAAPQVSVPTSSSSLQTAVLGAKHVSNPVVQSAVVGGTTSGVTGSATANAASTKMLVLPTNLKVNSNNKQWKVVYVQKPGAPRPELHLQQCTTDGSPQVLIPLAGTNQTTVGTAPNVTAQKVNPGAGMQLQMVPQGPNKVTVKAVNSVDVPRAPASTSHPTSGAPMTNTPVSGTGVLAPGNVVITSVKPAIPSILSRPQVQETSPGRTNMVLPQNSVLHPGTNSNAAPEAEPLTGGNTLDVAVSPPNQLMIQTLSPPGLVLKAPEPSMKQIVVPRSPEDVKIKL